jgi:hypothetical protein
LRAKKARNINIARSVDPNAVSGACPCAAKCLRRGERRQARGNGETAKKHHDYSELEAGKTHVISTI